MGHIQLLDLQSGQFNQYQTITVGKVLCVGRNYAEHIEELNNSVPDEMVIFHKTSSSVTQILTAFHQEPLHYEAEICFLIKDNQFSAVGLGLDLTKRGMQSKLKSKGLPWERAKAFDGSAVMSRFLPIEAINIDDLSLELFVNGVRVQKGHVNQMLNSPTDILREVQAYTSTDDGDIIMTGTPKGVGEIHQGDRFTGKLLCDENVLLEVEWIAQ